MMRSRPRAGVALVRVCFLGASMAFASPPTVTTRYDMPRDVLARVERPPPSELGVLQLLDSTDLTDQTWGAFWAGQFKVESARVKVQALLRQTALGGVLPTSLGYSAADERQRKLCRAALDALIQIEASVDPKVLDALGAEFPNEVAILRLNAPEPNEQQLIDLFEAKSVGGTWRIAAHVLGRMATPRSFAVLARRFSIPLEFGVYDHEGVGYVIGRAIYCNPFGAGTDGTLPPTPFYAVQGTAAELKLIRQWTVPDPPDIHEAMEINALFRRTLGIDITPLISGHEDVVWKSPRAWARTLEDARVGLQRDYERFTQVAHTAGFEVPAFGAIPIDIVIQDMRKSPRPAIARPTWARNFEVVRSQDN